MNGDDVLVAIVSLATLIAGVVVIVAGLRYRAQMRELRHRERLALIERGLTPPPEQFGVAVHHGLKQRSLSFGIIVVGLGFALMFLIGIAGGAAETGVGVGGAVAILGAAFIVRSIFAPTTAVSYGPPAPRREEPNQTIPL